jgi:hypothetical protein
MEMGETKKVCSCGHHKVLPIIVILLGLAFLLGALNVLTATVVNMIWPILLIIGGVVKMSESRCSCC